MTGNCTSIPLPVASLPSPMPIDADVLVCVAYVAARLVTDIPAASIVDHRRGVERRIGCTVRDGRVGLYDYDRQCSFSGTLSDLADEATGVRLSLAMEGTRFSAESRWPQIRFWGEVNGASVAIHLEPEAAPLEYSLITLSA